MTPLAVRAIDMVIAHEGGLVDHPRDPGGLTKYGISIRAYPALGRDGIKNLTDEQAREIYHRDYWKRVHGDALTPAAAIVCMDAAVNSGVKRASRWLQQALHMPIDGEIGPQTIARCHECDQKDVARQFTELRMDFLHRLPTFDTFGKGWTRRVEETLQIALREAAP